MTDKKETATELWFLTFKIVLFVFVQLMRFYNKKQFKSFFMQINK